MLAIVTTASPDGPTLAPAEIDRPRPGPADLLVRVRAAALNRADLRRSQQHFAAGEGPDIAGLEMAGEVVEAGPEAKGFAPGDRVMAMARGCYAEYVAVDHRLAIPVPPAVAWAEAAALPVWFMTAHDALVTAGRLRPGESVLIQGATSGVGLAALQVARHLGAGRILGTSTSPAKLDALARLGLDHGIVLGRDDVAAAVRDATAGKGADIVIDMIGAGQLAANVAACALAGRIVTVGRLGGFTDTIDLDQVALKRLALVGVTFRTRSLAEKRAVIEAMQSDLGAGLADGSLKPIVDRVFPLAEALAAQDYMKKNAHLGKIVLSV